MAWDNAGLSSLSSSDGEHRKQVNQGYYAYVIDMSNLKHFVNTNPNELRVIAINSFSVNLGAGFHNNSAYTPIANKV